MWPFKDKRTPEEQAVAKRIVEGVFSGEYQLIYYKDKTTIYNDKTFNITTVYPVVLRDDTGILTKWECFKILYIASKRDKENREETLKRNRKKLAEAIARVL